MKYFAMLAIALISFSSFAKECELDILLAADSSHVELTLTEKDRASPDLDIIKELIGEREQSDCRKLEKVLESKNLKLELEGAEMEVKIVNLSPRPVVSLLND